MLPVVPRVQILRKRIETLKGKSSDLNPLAYLLQISQIKIIFLLKMFCSFFVFSLKEMWPLNEYVFYVKLAKPVYSDSSLDKLW